MTEIDGRVAAALSASLEVAEPLRFATVVVVARFISADTNRDTPRIGLALARAGAVHGDMDSMAARVPAPPAPGNAVSWLLITDRRAAMVSLDHRAELVGDVNDARLYWHVPLAAIARVEKRSRLQGARFRLHFADGSNAMFITKRMRDVQALRQLVESGRS